MKKITRLFALAVAALGFVGMVATTGCGKDDGSNITQEMWYNSHEEGDPFFPTESWKLRPKFVVENSYYGYNFDVKWTKAVYDTIQFEYELCWSYNQSNHEEYHSLGRQKDSIYHFSVDDIGIEFPSDDERIYLILNTYYWHNGHERRVQTYSAFRKVPGELTKVDYSNNNIHIDFFQGSKKEDLEYLKKIVVLLVDLDNDGNVTNVYESFTYDNNSLEFPTEVFIEDVYPEWSGYLDIQLFNLDGSFKIMFIEKVEK